MLAGRHDPFLPIALGAALHRLNQEAFGGVSCLKQRTAFAALYHRGIVFQN